jgi:hypothetical protein
MSSSDNDCPPLAVPLTNNNAYNDDDDEEMPDLVETLADPTAATGSSFSAAKNDNEDEDGMPKKKIPITIITGFLGSGKSTLLDYILTEKHDFKVAVILNEFGDTGGIDQAMNVGMGGEVVEEWLELKNGCLCCTVKYAYLHCSLICRLSLSRSLSLSLSFFLSLSLFGSILVQTAI